jgi:stress response protein YsnF
MNDPSGQESRPVPAVVLSEEHASIGTERFPYRRLRVAKRIVVEQQTITVDVRREELVVEELDLDDAGTAARAEQAEPLVMVLSREVVDAVQLRAEPVELVRVQVDRNTDLRPVDVDLRREQADLDIRR